MERRMTDACSRRSWFDRLTTNGFGGALARGGAPRLLAVAALALLALPARADERVLVSGSVYVDYWGIADQEIGARAPRSVTPETSLKVGVDIHDDLSFSIKACAMCHGVELESAFLEWQPSMKFNVQAGRIAVPFGEYANRVDPSGHKTASAPLIYDMGRMAYGEKSAFNFGVMMQPYTDTGVLLYGIFWLGESLQVWYGAYGVSGLRGSNDVDWTALRTLYYTDNNNQPAGGGRLAVTYASPAGAFLGDVSLGASGTAGRYDRDANLGYVAWAWDASMKLGPLTFRGEYAERKTDLDPSVSYRFVMVDKYLSKKGWYGEIEHPIGRYLSAVYRYDELRRVGVPLPGAPQDLSTDSRINRYTAGLVITPAQAIYMKLGWEYWEPTDFPEFHSAHVGFGGAF
jgi:hypothetical protein